MESTGKISFTLDELRLRSFDTAPEAEEGKGTVHANQCACTGCSSCTGCSLCTHCTRCSVCSNYTNGGGGCQCRQCTSFWTY